MKRIIFTAVTLFCLLGVSFSTQAAPVAMPQLMTCALRFSASGGGFQLFVGNYELQGFGTINCVGTNGVGTALPVRITLGSAPIAFNLALAQNMTVQGIATGINVSQGPESLMGSYVALSGQGAISVFGVGGIVAFENPLRGITLSLGISHVSGFGASLGVTRLQISPL